MSPIFAATRAGLLITLIVSSQYRMEEARTIAWYLDSIKGEPWAPKSSCLFVMRHFYRDNKTWYDIFYWKISLFPDERGN